MQPTEIEGEWHEPIEIEAFHVTCIDVSLPLMHIDYWVCHVVKNMAPKKIP